jgi:hypothetical protein
MKEVAVLGADGEEGDKSEDPEGRSDSERGSSSGRVCSTGSIALTGENGGWSKGDVGVSCAFLSSSNP